MKWLGHVAAALLIACAAGDAGACVTIEDQESAIAPGVQHRRIAAPENVQAFGEWLARTIGRDSFGGARVWLIVWNGEGGAMGFFFGGDGCRLGWVRGPIEQMLPAALGHAL